MREWNNEEYEPGIRTDEIKEVGDLEEGDYFEIKKFDKLGDQNVTYIHHYPTSMTGWILMDKPEVMENSQEIDLGDMRLCEGPDLTFLPLSRGFKTAKKCDVILLLKYDEPYSLVYHVPSGFRGEVKSNLLLERTKKI